MNVADVMIRGGSFQCGAGGVHPAITPLPFRHPPAEGVAASDGTAYMPREQKPPLSERNKTDLAQYGTAESPSEPSASA